MNGEDELMTHNETASPSKRLAGVLGLLPIVGIGFYAHKHDGTDGIAGILLGLYFAGYLLVFVPRWG